MLTESERQWLKQRDEHPENRFCHWCPHNAVRGREEEEGVWTLCQAEDVDGLWECVTEHYYFDRLWDAAEFEARVAAKLAEASLDCKDSIMKWARLAVEKEMDDADRKRKTMAAR